MNCVCWSTHILSVTEKSLLIITIRSQNFRKLKRTHFQNLAKHTHDTSGTKSK